MLAEYINQGVSMTEVSAFSFDQWHLKRIDDPTAPEPPTPPVPLPQIDNWRYVSPGGNDAGSGTIEKPFATLAAALASITDASPTKRYAVFVTGTILAPAGTTINIPPNVLICGSSPQQSRISADEWTTNHAAWSNADDNRSGFVNVGVAGTVSVDFRQPNAASGKFYMSNAWALDPVLFEAKTLTNQFIAAHVHFFATFVARGGELDTTGCTFHGELTFRESSTTPGFAGTYSSSGDVFLSNLAVLNNGNTTETVTAIVNSYVSFLFVTGLALAKVSGRPASSTVDYPGGSKVESTTVPQTAGINGRRWMADAGPPNNNIVGWPGDIYVNTNGGAGQTFWVKETGVQTNTGWVAK
jgi:hypothetical protein